MNLVTVKRAALAGVLLAGMVILPAHGEKWALLVGINEYDAFPDLKGCENDARLLKQILISSFGFAEENVRVLLTREATVDNIIKGFTDFLAMKSKPGDWIVFSFSGHGSQVRDRNGDEEDGKDEILLGRDTQYNAGGPYISDDQINELLAQLPGRTVLVLLDCCNSGTGTRGLVPGIRGLRPETDDFRVRGVNMLPETRDATPPSPDPNSGWDATESAQSILLAAAQANQQAMDTTFSTPAGERRSQGAFTKYLVEGLQGPADRDRSGKITLDEAQEYATRALKDNGFKQDPYFECPKGLRSAPFYGDVAMPAGAVAVTAVTQPAQPSSPTPDPGIEKARKAAEETGTQAQTAKTAAQSALAALERAKTAATQAETQAQASRDAAERAAKDLQSSLDRLANFESSARTALAQAQTSAEAADAAAKKARAALPSGTTRDASRLITASETAEAASQKRDTAQLTYDQAVKDVQAAAQEAERLEKAAQDAQALAQAARVAADDATAKASAASDLEQEVSAQAEAARAASEKAAAAAKQAAQARNDAKPVSTAAPDLSSAESALAAAGKNAKEAAAAARSTADQAAAAQNAYQRAAAIQKSYRDQGGGAGSPGAATWERALDGHVAAADHAAKQAFAAAEAAKQAETQANAQESAAQASLARARSALQASAQGLLEKTASIAGLAEQTGALAARAAQAALDAGSAASDARSQAAIARTQASEAATRRAVAVKNATAASAAAQDATAKLRAAQAAAAKAEATLAFAKLEASQKEKEKHEADAAEAQRIEQEKRKQAEQKAAEERANLEAQAAAAKEKAEAAQAAAQAEQLKIDAAQREKERLDREQREKERLQQEAEALRLEEQKKLEAAQQEQARLKDEERKRQEEQAARLKAEAEQRERLKAQQEEADRKERERQQAAEEEKRKQEAAALERQRLEEKRRRKEQEEKERIEQAQKEKEKLQTASVAVNNLPPPPNVPTPPATPTVVTLPVGTDAGVSEGSVFAVFPTNGSADAPEGKVQITSVSPDHAEGVLVQGTVSPNAAAQCVFRPPVVRKLRVSLDGEGSLYETLLKTIRALDTVELRPENQADRRILVDPDGTVRIRNPWGDLIQGWKATPDSQSIPQQVAYHLVMNYFARQLADMSNPRPPFRVTLRPVPEEHPIIKIDEIVTYEITCDADARILVLNLDASGDVTVLFPNAAAKDNFVRAGQTLRIGKPDDPYEFVAGEPTGEVLTKVFAFAADAADFDLLPEKEEDKFRTFAGEDEAKRLNEALQRVFFDPKKEIRWAEASVIQECEP